MLAKVQSGAVYGVDAYTVEIEVNAGNGDTQVVVVGLPDAAVKESKDRVWTALLNSGFLPHRGRTTVNLAPASLRKSGASLDLPIAIGVLAAAGALENEPSGGLAFIGELALDSRLRPIGGALAQVLALRDAGCKSVVVPEACASQAALAPGVDVIGAPDLAAVLGHLLGTQPLPVVSPG